MTKLSCLLIVVTLATSLVAAQAKHATLVINYQKSEGKDTLAFPVWPIVQTNFLQRLPLSLVYQTKYHITDGDCQVTEDFTLNEPTAVILADLFGHEVYVEPGDTIYIRPLKKTKEEFEQQLNNLLR